ncbi:MAG: bifunctional histidinol-phosphatase/imidazoleglycerol-phosphate dehydratase HisB [Spirochaetota bacterium]
MRPVLFIDRDGVILREPGHDYQIDSLEKFEFIPGVIRALTLLRSQTPLYFAMVSNQDGLGTASFPREDFDPPHQLMLNTLAGEGITFDAIHIDPSMPAENSPNRKPGTGMLQEYLDKDGELYDLEHSYVVGDRLSDLELASRLGCKALWFAPETQAGELSKETAEIQEACELVTDNWLEAASFLIERTTARRASLTRETQETRIEGALNLDGSGRSEISTGLHFLDHMLDQLARHSGCDLTLKAEGDLEVDEHHTLEDTALTLGELFRRALGDKRGISRYGFLLPMDESLAQVAIDFSGRPWLVWDVALTRDMVGDVPSELFFHFFKSFSDQARCTLNIQASGDNSHHIMEAVFKGFAKAVKGAVARDLDHMELPTTKGMLS